MANMETFYKGLMVSEDVTAFLRTAKYKEDGAYAVVSDGALVTLGSLEPSAAYNSIVGTVSSVNDYNVFAATAPAAVTDPVCIVDVVDVSHGDIMGNDWRAGIKLVGLKPLAGTPVRVRKLALDDMFWLSPDCFTALPTQGQYAIATAGSTQHTPAATAPTDGSYCVKIEDANKDFTVGNQAYGKLYLCRVVSIPSAAL